jgi:hypothetical protein
MRVGVTTKPTLAALIIVLLVSGGCATRPFEAREIDKTSFIDRVVTQEQGGVRVSAAVPTAEEVIAFTGLDLYDQDIQPVWLEIKNDEPHPVRVALFSIDDEYYSPMEVAWYYRKGYSREGKAAMERWLYENGLPRGVPAGETRSGLVFTHLVEGTKGFNVDIYASNESFNFTFFVPMPGFRPDYMDVRFADLYEPDDLLVVDIAGLRDLLSDYGCCSTDAAGSGLGDPLNVAIVATPIALRRALLRSQWQETQSGSDEGTLARQHYFDGRIPDGTFHKARPDGSERKELRIWLSPIRLGEIPVWLAQASYDISAKNRSRSFKNYQIDPDVDDARIFLLQSFWYGQSLERFGLSGGVPAATIDAPKQNFVGSSWFTDGKRIVMFVAEEPVAMDETEILVWEQYLD